MDIDIMNTDIIINFTSGDKVAIPVNSWEVNSKSNELILNVPFGPIDNFSARNDYMFIQSGGDICEASFSKY